MWSISLSLRSPSLPPSLLIVLIIYGTCWRCMYLSTK